MADLVMKGPMVNYFLGKPSPYEPKKQNRFLVRFTKGLDIPLWYINTSSRPSVYFKEYTLFGFTLFKRRIWRDITITLHDLIDKSTTYSLMPLTEIESNQMISFDLELLDPTGAVVELWKLECKVKEIDFGPLDMSSKKIAFCRLVVKPIKVEFHY
jgi:hypothetical protein